MRFFDVENSLDYYSFGMLMPERFGGGDYRYGYGGLEKDDEIKGNGNSYTTHYRMLDPRIGRWFSTDPLEDKHPYASPYNYVLNSPISAIDKDGDDVIFLISKDGAGGHGHMAALIQDKDGTWYYVSQGANTEARGVSAIAGMFSGAFKAGMGIYSLGTKDANAALDYVYKASKKFDANNPVSYNAPITSHLKIETSSKMDEKIFKKAGKLQKRYEKGLLRYNIITQNCVDAVQQCVKAGTGDVPLDIDPRPNKYFERLQNKADKWQERINKKMDRQEKRDTRKGERAKKKDKKKEESDG